MFLSQVTTFTLVDLQNLGMRVNASYTVYDKRNALNLFLTTLLLHVGQYTYMLLFQTEHKYSCLSQKKKTRTKKQQSP